VWGRIQTCSWICSGVRGWKVTTTSQRSTRSEILLDAGVGFLFVIYTVMFELVMGIPLKRQSVFVGGSPINKASSVN